MNKNPESTINSFLYVFEELKKILFEENVNFSNLIGVRNFIPRYFQVIFLALYELLLEDLVINNYSDICKTFEGIGKHIKLDPGGNWSGKSRKTNIDAIKGILKKDFRKKLPSEENPSIDSWTTRFENILMQSFTEQALYDFKQGFHNLDNIGDFNLDLFHKIIKTLIAMANHAPNSKGFVIVGIADNKSDSDRLSKLYSISHLEFNKFFVTGVQGEVKKFHNDNFDNYYNYILNLLKNEPVSRAFLEQNLRVRIINYFDKSVVIFEVTANSEPILYDKKYYFRRGSNTEEVLPESYSALFKRFLK